MGAWWVKPLILLVLLVGSFGAGVVYESHVSQGRILEAARKEREALVVAMSEKMSQMHDAAVESATIRTQREADLEASVPGMIKEAVDAVVVNPACNMPVGAVRILNGVQRRRPEASGQRAVPAAR